MFHIFVKFSFPANNIEHNNVFYFDLYTLHCRFVCIISQQMHYSDSLLIPLYSYSIHSAATLAATHHLSIYILPSGQSTNISTNDNVISVMAR
jgi:hypothetical protein